MERILIIEDDQEIAELLKRALQLEYKLHFAYSGTEAIYKLKENTYNLILLDLMLPGIKGKDLLLIIREISNASIIIITAIQNHQTVVEQLNNGANDYITKPFHLGELKARIAVQLRESKRPHKIEQIDFLQYKNLKLDVLNQKCFINKQLVTLTRKEFQIVELLLRNRKRIFSKQELYEIIWKKDYLEDENTINVHISTLRKKFERYDMENTYIETVWGMGIRLMEAYD